MSNTSIRGSEQSVRLAIADKPATGTFLRVKSFTATPLTDIMEDDYCGEALTEFDVQHHGWGLAITFDEDDDSAINFTARLTANEEEHRRPQRVTVTAFTVYRDGVTRPLVEVFPDLILVQKSRTNGGRKERIKNEFEAKCKHRDVIRQ